MYETTIKAAKWWTDKISNPGFGSFNMGDDSQIGAVAMILGLNLTTPDKDEAIDKFKSLLEEYIEEQIKEKGSCCIDTDYHPEYALSQIISKAGVSSSNFPWKTNMTVTENSVEVSCGSGAKWVKL